jgi:hypothetical protein
MHQVFLLSDKWTGLFIVLVGVYTALLAYKILPLKAGDPEFSANWHKKYGRLMKVLGPVMILCGVGALLLTFLK